MESALEAGAVMLLTEDLQHDQTFAGLRVVNPFRELFAVLISLAPALI